MCFCSCACVLLPLSSLFKNTACPGSGCSSSFSSPLPFSAPAHQHDPHGRVPAYRITACGEESLLSSLPAAAAHPRSADGAATQVWLLLCFLFFSVSFFFSPSPGCRCLLPSHHGQAPSGLGWCRHGVVLALGDPVLPAPPVLPATFRGLTAGRRELRLLSKRPFLGTFHFQQKFFLGGNSNPPTLIPLPFPLSPISSFSFSLPFRTPPTSRLFLAESILFRSLLRHAARLWALPWIPNSMSAWQ